jgi:hypothetical protein
MRRGLTSWQTRGRRQLVLLGDRPFGGCWAARRSPMMGSLAASADLWVTCRAYWRAVEVMAYSSLAIGCEQLARVTG